MTQQILCKYYMSGCCKKGDACPFGHDLNQLPNLVCTYYLAGCCSYGDKCRYDHKRPDRQQQQHSSSSRPVSVRGPPGHASLDSRPPPPAPPPLPAPTCNPWTAAHTTGTNGGKMDPSHFDWDSYDPWEQQAPPLGGSMDPADTPICSQYAATGSCSRGEACALIHGDLCETCERLVLHPYNPQLAAEHKVECEARHQRLQARIASAEVECGICLERVLGKANPADRKFGVLACAHPFCLPCIRNWRSTGEADTDTAVRTCPICRTTAHFVTPTALWPTSEEEKRAMVEGYKQHLGGIDCRHFNFGDGSCPFSSSCFYRHVHRDGTPADHTLRKYGTADGEVKVVQPVRLSDFLTVSSRGLSRRR